jgi:23S rRNA (uracil1939-C5)-methyltransferase
MAVEPLDRGRLALGYYQERSRETVDAPECRVLEPALVETLAGLRSALPAIGQAARVLRHVDLRCGSDPRRQHLTLVLAALEAPRLQLGRLLERCPHVAGVAVNVHPGSGPQVLKGPIAPVQGEREVWVDLPTARLRVSPGAFFQVNLHVLPAIHERLRVHLAGGRVLADLYAGVGTHGLALAGAYQRVLCIEGVRRAVADARASIAASLIGHARVIASPVERALRALVEGGADRVVLNPSRQGAEPVVLDALARGPAERIGYLSCEPVTLARDLDLLVRMGFAVSSVEPVDMMPQTRQVEALALLERR